MEAASRGYRIHYVAEGAGPCLVLVPGLLMGAKHWAGAGYVEAFANDYRVIAIDPLGHGASSKPHETEAYAPLDCGRDVIAVLDAEGVESAHFWGYSRGASVAQAAAVVAPRRARSVISGGTGFPLPTTPPPPMYVQHFAMLAGTLERGDWGTFWMMMGLSDPGAVSALQAEQDPQAIAAVIRAQALLPEEFEQPIPAGGVLVYAGRQEPMFEPMQMLARAAGARFEAVPGCGHLEAFRALGLVEPFVRVHLARAEKRVALAGLA